MVVVVVVEGSCGGVREAVVVLVAGGCGGGGGCQFVWILPDLVLEKPDSSSVITTVLHPDMALYRVFGISPKVTHGTYIWFLPRVDA